MFFFNKYFLSKKKSKRCERKTPIISNLKYKIWAHRLSIKGTKPLFTVMKAIINILKNSDGFEGYQKTNTTHQFVILVLYTPSKPPLFSKKHLVLLPQWWPIKQEECDARKSLYSTKSCTNHYCGFKYIKIEDTLDVPSRSRERKKGDQSLSD